MIQDPKQLFLVFLATVLAALVLDKRFAFARKLSPVLMILFFSAVLSNCGIITDQSPFYETLIGFTVPFAVCLVLFTVQLKDLKTVGIPMLAAFAIACAGTFFAALIAGGLLHPYLREILGGQAWKLAGPFTGTYIGGSLNFFAVWIFVPDLLGPRYPVGKVWKSRTPPAVEQEVAKSTPTFRIVDVVALALLALVVIEGSDLIKERFIAEHFPRFPTILLVTTFALILAQLRYMGRLEGAFEMGNLSFYLFFCTVGAMINLEKAVALCPILFLYVIIIMTVHMVVVYGVGRLFRLDIKILTMASTATKSGPACVIALANVKGWKGLLLPGMAMGLLGYALGNYLGFAAAYLMKVLLGG